MQSVIAGDRHACFHKQLVLCTFMLTQLYDTSEHDPPEKVKDTVPVQQASELDSFRNSGDADRYGARDIKT